MSPIIRTNYVWKEALMKYQVIVGKASLSNEGDKKTPFGGLVPEQRTEERPLKKVVINGVEIQLLEDKLVDLLTIVSKKTSKREEKEKE